MIKRIYIFIALSVWVLSALALTSVASAAQASSTNWGVNEVRFGSGGELRACSTAYCAKQSAGELTVGNTKSTNYQAQAGGNTDREPFLEVILSGGTLNLGALTTTTTGTATTTFSVKSYLASGYNVYISGTTPRNNTSNNPITTMGTATTSSPGTEQFGINLVLNTSPAIGANPLQVPDNTFGFGTFGTGYGTQNNFKYVANDVIATSLKSSGQTTYTMSMIANISTTTGGGAYNGRLGINVVPTF